MTTRFAPSMIVILVFGVITSLQAGQKVTEKLIEKDAIEPWWHASLSTGWDSLYMYRGANVIPNDNNGYGSSISWTSVNLTLDLTANDFLAIGTWTCFGIFETDYKEFDFNASYTHTFGDLALTLGYGMFDTINAPSAYRYSHSLGLGVAYAWRFGIITLAPAINYSFSAGPPLGHGGYAPNASSYLEFRVNGSIPVYKDVAMLAPYVSLATNFRYNVTSKTDPASPFNGANNAETGITLRIAVNKAITLAPYVAYSYQWNQIAGTTPGTFWGGGAVIFNF